MSFHLFVVVFFCIPASWESYMAPRQPIGVRGGWGELSQGSSLLPIGRQGVIYDSLPHGCAFYIAIRIRAKGWILFSVVLCRYI